MEAARRTSREVRLDMARLFVFVEGETEEKFVNDTLAPHLCGSGYFSDVRARLLGNAQPRSRRGGIVAWSSARKDIIRHLRQDRRIIIALLVDFYAMLKTGFRAWPGRDGAGSGREIETAIEASVANEMGSAFHVGRFVPCVMMHEFEAMLFSDCNAFARAIGRPEVFPELQVILDRFGAPEAINDTPDGAPSKRILRLVPEYDKLLSGNRAVQGIGLQRVREKCSHFGGWLQRLETSADSIGQS